MIALTKRQAKAQMSDQEALRRASKGCPAPKKLPTRVLAAVVPMRRISVSTVQQNEQQIATN
jgi:hypothetical protein